MNSTPGFRALVRFIDSHRDRFGAEPVCVVLGFPVSTYYAAKKREWAPSARTVCCINWLTLRQRGKAKLERLAALPA